MVINEEPQAMSKTECRERRYKGKNVEKWPVQADVSKNTELQITYDKFVVFSEQLPKESSQDQVQLFKSMTK